VLALCVFEDISFAGGCVAMRKIKIFHLSEKLPTLKNVLASYLHVYTLRVLMEVVRGSPLTHKTNEEIKEYF